MATPKDREEAVIAGLELIIKGPTQRIDIEDLRAGHIVALTSTLVIEPPVWNPQTEQWRYVVKSKQLGILAQYTTCSTILIRPEEPADDQP